MTQHDIRVWLLVGPKAGDNAQLRALGAGLARSRGWLVVEKPLSFRPGELLLHAASMPTLAGLRPESRRGLEPPWPDLVLTAGRRNELVARWIGRRSGCRLVHLGRPWSRPERFDLVIATPQYALPPGPGVMVIPLPLHPPDPDALSAAGDAWLPRLHGLPRPWTAVLVGGDSGPFVFTADLARNMGECLNRLAGELGGSLLITTSPRTPAAFAEALRRTVAAPGWFHPWTRNARDNPYAGLLALADGFVVTAESISMVTEALNTGKPVRLAPVTPPGRRPWWLRISSYRWKPLTHRLAMAVAPQRFSRDVGRIHGALLETRRVTWLGEGDVPVPAHGTDPLSAAVERVSALLEAGNRGEAGPRLSVGQ